MALIKYIIKLIVIALFLIASLTSTLIAQKSSKSVTGTVQYIRLAGGFHEYKNKIILKLKEHPGMSFVIPLKSQLYEEVKSNFNNIIGQSIKLSYKKVIIKSYIFKGQQFEVSPPEIDNVITSLKWLDK